MRKYLINLRNEYGLSQQDVAQKLGISRQYYQMIENGERQKHLALPLASSIATLYGISVIDVERYEREMSTDSAVH